jgi:hypothetical protein
MTPSSRRRFFISWHEAVWMIFWPGCHWPPRQRDGSLSGFRHICPVFAWRGERHCTTKLNLTLRARADDNSCRGLVTIGGFFTGMPGRPSQSGHAPREWACRPGPSERGLWVSQCATELQRPAGARGKSRTGVGLNNSRTPALASPWSSRAGPGVAPPADTVRYPLSPDPTQPRARR